VAERLVLVLPEVMALMAGHPIVVGVVEEVAERHPPRVMLEVKGGHQAEEEEEEEPFMLPLVQVPVEREEEEWR
jgi:hypothetical protein